MTELPTRAFEATFDHVLHRRVRELILERRDRCVFAQAGQPGQIREANRLASEAVDNAKTANKIAKAALAIAIVAATASGVMGYLQLKDGSTSQPPVSWPPVSYSPASWQPS